MSPVSARSTRSRNAGSERPAIGQAGFTIVELLTVLVLFGLLSFVLLTGFERVLDIRLRLTTFLDGVEAPVLVADWFRSTIGGLVATAPNGPDSFVGGPRQMTGLSLAPLNGTAGVPTHITWGVIFDDQTGRSVLNYRNGEGQAMTIASWPGDSGGLRYCDPDLVCRDTWLADPRAKQQLPLLVELDAVKGTEPWPILAAPLSDRAVSRVGADRP